MKKFITALVSFLLAGSMAFSFAACKKNDDPTDPGNNGGNNGGNNEETPGENSGNNGGTEENNGTEVVNKELLDAINATMSADKYKLTTSSVYNYTILFNGNKITADTVLISTPQGDFTGLDFYKMMMEDDELTAEDFENPIPSTDGVTTYSFDFASGIAKIEEVYDDETYIEYYDVDGTTINRYRMNERGEWNPDTDVWEVTEIVPEQRSYTGYADEAQAKQIFKKALLSDVYGMTLEEITNTTVKGVGANADKEGTLFELIDLFDYDATTQTYSVTVAAATNNESPATAIESDFSITVKDGKVSEMTTSLTMDRSMEDEMPGVSMQIGISQTSKYSDVGTVSVAVDEDYKDVKEEDIYVTSVVATEALWKELLTDYAMTDFSISYSNYTEDSYESYNIYVDTESKVAVIENSGDNGSGYHTERTLYRVEGDKIVEYNFVQNDNGEPDSFVKSDEIAITGDATAALIEAIGDDYVKDYYAGFAGGALSEQFAKFEFYGFSELKASLKMNNKDVEIFVSFGYDSGNDKNYVSDIRIEYDDKYFYVSGNAKNNIESWVSQLPTD